MCRLEPTLQMRCSDNNLFGYADNELRFKTTSTKTKITIAFPLKGDLVNLNINYEIIKNASVLIEVKDETSVWAVIQGRLLSD